MKNIELRLVTGELKTKFTLYLSQILLNGSALTVTDRRDVTISALIALLAEASIGMNVDPEHVIGLYQDQWTKLITGQEGGFLV